MPHRAYKDFSIFPKSFEFSTSEIKKTLFVQKNKNFFFTTFDMLFGFQMSFGQLSAGNGEIRNSLYAL